MNSVVIPAAKINVSTQATFEPASIFSKKETINNLVCLDNIFLYVQTETVLMYEAVQLSARALDELDQVTLYCKDMV